MPIRALLLTILFSSGWLGAEDRFEFLEATRRPSWEPSISGRGEVVFLAIDRNGHPNVFSSRRGQITHSMTGQLRSPSVNESGELVFADRFEGEAFFEIWSSDGTQISPRGGNSASISSSGEVCFVTRDQSGIAIWSSVRGPLVILRNQFATSCDINDGGELVYLGRDSNGKTQIFSLQAGQLTQGARARLGSPAINDLGEIVYVEAGELHSFESGQITNSGGRVGHSIDINNSGDIVFPLESRGTYRTLVATTSPERYPELKASKVSLRWVGPDLEVEIAIAPSPGTFDLPPARLGRFPVVLFSTQESTGEKADFDASSVDELSVRLGRDRLKILVRSMAEVSDVDGDGDMDKIIWFKSYGHGRDCPSGIRTLVGKTTTGQAFKAEAETLSAVCRSP